MTVNLWTDAAHAQSYLGHRKLLPRREVGYQALLELVPEVPGRVLDLGCGDGEVVARVIDVRPVTEAVAVDFSPEMLRRVRERFAEAQHVTVVEHDLDVALPAEWGTFDVVVSAFAIHHVVDERKRALYAEVYDRLRPGGAFLNLEHVASPTPELHEAFLERHRHDARGRRPLQPARSGRSPAGVAAWRRVRAGRLPLEVAGAGPAGGHSRRLTTLGGSSHRSFSSSGPLPKSDRHEAMGLAQLEATVTYPEFLTYLFDREQTKELAVELAFVIDEQLTMEQRRSMQPA